jgi:hypothetical protein
MHTICQNSSISTVDSTSKCPGKMTSTGDKITSIKKARCSKLKNLLHLAFLMPTYLLKLIIYIKFARYFTNFY